MGEGPVLVHRRLAGFRGLKDVYSSEDSRSQAGSKQSTLVRHYSMLHLLLGVFLSFSLLARENNTETPKAVSRVEPRDEDMRPPLVWMSYSGLRTTDCRQLSRQYANEGDILHLTHTEIAFRVESQCPNIVLAMLRNIRKGPLIFDSARNHDVPDLSET